MGSIATHPVPSDMAQSKIGNKLTIKDYNYTTVVNANVSPYKAHVSINMSTDVATYGNIVSATAITRSVNPTCTAVSYTNQGVFVWSMIAEDGVLRVAFSK